MQQATPMLLSSYLARGFSTAVAGVSMFPRWRATIRAGRLFEIDLEAVCRRF